MLPAALARLLPRGLGPDSTEPQGTALDAAYWSMQPHVLGRALGTGFDGLSSAEAAARLKQYGPNSLRESRRLSRTRVLLDQLRSPLLLLLVFAAVMSALTSEWTDALIVLTILVVSVAIGALTLITALYVVTTELAKRGFYRAART